MAILERGRHRAEGHGLGRRFSILWTGQIVSQFGDYLSYFSIPLFVVFLSTEDAPTNLALTYTIETIPAVVVGFFGGLLIDRLPIRASLILSDLARAAAFGYLAFFASTGPEQDSEVGLASVFVVAFVAGTFLNLFAGGLYVLVKQLVGQDRLAEANGKIAAVQNLAFALAPAIAGLLVSATGRFTLVFSVNALSFLLSALSIALIGPVRRIRSGHEVEDENDHEGLLADVFNGLRYLWSEPRLRTSTVAIAVANLSVGFLESTLVLTANELGASEEWQVGVVFAALGFGAAFGAWLAPGFIRYLGLGRAMISGLFTMGLSFAVFTRMEFGPRQLFYVFVTFIGLQLINVPLVTIRQVFTPDIMLGRVLTAARAIGWAPTPIGALIGASLVSAEVVSFITAVRLAPGLIILAGIGLIPTIIWRDTFGPITTGDHPTAFLFGD
jgi:MFS family permease